MAPLATCLLLVISACTAATAPTATATPLPTLGATAATRTAAPTPPASPSGSATAAATPGSAPIGGAASALEDVASYRFAIEMQGADLLGSVPVPGGDFSTTGTVVLRPERALDFTIETELGVPLRYVLVGDEAWLAVGGGPLRDVPGGGAAAESVFERLRPENLLGSLAGQLDGLTVIGQETRNGVLTNHYRADADRAARIAQELGGQEFTAEAWLAADGDYLVAFAMSGTIERDGVPEPFGMKLDISGIDDPANRIERPS